MTLALRASRGADRTAVVLSLDWPGLGQLPQGRAASERSFANATLAHTANWTSRCTFAL